jgi:L-alanine-DL-glutamate epimerase-like enolase superfamily enzyme
MRLTRCDCQLLSLPAGGSGGPERVAVLLVRLDTDAGLRGLGFAYTLQGSGRALLATAVDDIAPLLTGEDPLDHERLAAKVQWRLQTVGRRGLVAQAYAAFDLALWDLKGKAADLPLFKLLGGARDAAPTFVGDAGWPGMEPGEVLDAARPLLDRGLMGVKLSQSGDPEGDADRTQRVRDALGEDSWLAVDAGQRYDYGTALALGHFFEEEIGVDWFENPVPCEDVGAHARLAAKLELPLAAGSALFGRDEFEAYLSRDAVTVLRPDVTRLGGLTAWLKVAALAERSHRPVTPHVMPEVAVHLACGLPGVSAVEYVRWLEPLWATPPRFEGGKMVPPPRPGLGLEVDPDVAGKFAVKG